MLRALPWCLLCVVASFACGSSPVRRLSPPEGSADRSCRKFRKQTHTNSSRDLERCALSGNTVTVRAVVDDMHHVRLSMSLRESVAACGELFFTVSALYPSGRTYDKRASVACEEVCKEDEKGEVGCYDAPLRSFDLVVEFESPLPGFTDDGKPVNGSVPLQISSQHGGLDSISTIARVQPKS